MCRAGQSKGEQSALSAERLLSQGTCLTQPLLRKRSRSVCSMRTLATTGQRCAPSCHPATAPVLPCYHLYQAGSQRVAGHSKWRCQVIRASSLAKSELHVGQAEPFCCAQTNQSRQVCHFSDVFLLSHSLSRGPFGVALACWKECKV